MFCKKINLMEKLIVRFNGEKNFIISFLNVTVNIFFVMSLSSMLIFPFFLALPFNVPIKHLIFLELELALTSLILYELKNVIERIKKDKIFIIENADGFTKIGIYVFLGGIVYEANSIINAYCEPPFKLDGMLFRFGDDGNLKPDIFVFIIIACISLVIGEVLRKAVKIKNENDLTI
ncbi:DUF2975 domain-containing protein [Clostridium sp. 001]|uniref:DUF2975 domain-containing protein n=1 Tax=Clostridium sp. 001 TaxID=1970093 RepID=UPI001C2BC154|nr:DUF2975 domain-containing protein [Clostridium sp. 001]QXE17812.1 hypothetical protein B5S50_02540 [Clostridium sp. 001]